MTEDKKIGSRIKTARLLAGYTRSQMGDFGISVNTLQSWEMGRLHLSLKGAQKIVNALSKAGIQCSMEWLLTGKGLHPRTFKEVEEYLFNSNSNDLDLSLASLHTLSKEDIMAKEAAFFQVLNANSITMSISDDAMEPQFPVGGLIGGKRHEGIAISRIIGSNCIIETSSHHIYFRKLLSGTKPDRYNLTSINPSTKIENPIIYNQKIISAAPVLWHRYKEQ